MFPRLLATLALSFGFTSQAAAWGFEGHRIVAEIAEYYLNPETARLVRELLAIENVTSLADVSTWADQIRAQRPETAPWHYVDIPIHPQLGERNDYVPTRDCPLSNCVVAKIDQLMSDMRIRAMTPQRQLETLKFLVHFVGDIHQPLHAANDDDHGGNDINVTFMGQKTNLHAVWDSGILEAASASGDERAYAMRLADSITEEQVKRWSFGTSAYWANESHKIAVRVIYNVLPHLGTLPDDYEDVALPIVDEQLEKAGVRLAMVLNAELVPSN